MPYTGEHIRSTLLFNLVGGEVASTSVAWIQTDGDTIADRAVATSAIADQCDAFWSAIKGSFAITLNYVGSHQAVIDVNGHVDETFTYDRAPQNGFSDNNNLPSECAIVVSLKTAVNNRRGRGRMYLPCPAVNALQNSGRLTAGTTTSIADGAEDFLLVTLTAGGHDFVPVVASKADFALRPITQLKVGDVVDAQRRRRDALSEVYQVRTP